MIRIYTSFKYFKLGEVLEDNEDFFNKIKLSYITSEAQEIMYDIDKAYYLGLGKISTPFGTTVLKNLSTSCKTVLNLLYYSAHKEDFTNIKALNVTECGWEAIEKIFELIEKYSIDLPVILKHMNGSCNYKERDYLINDKEHMTDITFL